MVAGVCAGEPRTVFLVAGAGLGKTSVLGAVAQCARERGLVTVRACGEAMESGLGFGLLDQILVGLGGARRRDVLSPAEPGTDPRAAKFFRALTVLQRIPGGVIVLDDLHWSDVDSLAFVSFLCRRPGVLPSAWGVLAALRPWPADAHTMCRGLVNDERASSFELLQLTEQGAADLLAADVGAAVAPGVVHDMWVATAGNPLLLHQAARTLQEGIQVPFPAAWSSEVAGQLLLARFGGMPPAGMRWLQAAAVLGSRFLPEVATAIAGLSEDEQAGAIEAASRGGVIGAVTGGRCEFQHPLFREAVYDHLPSPVRVLLHGRAMRELADRGLEAEAAEHAVRAHRVGDPASVELLTRTGQAALAEGAFQTAADRLRTALDLSGAHPSAALLLALGESLVACPHAEAAAAVALLLLGIRDLPIEILVTGYRLLARAEHLLGDMQASGGHFAEAVSAAEKVSAELTVEILTEWSQAEWVRSPGRALPLAARARALAASCSSQAAFGADLVWTHQMLQIGDPAGLKTLHGLEGPHHAGGPELTGRWSVQVAMIGIDVLTEQYDGDDDRYRRTVAAAEAAGAPEAAATHVLMHSYGLTRLGQLESALAVLDRSRGLIDLVPAREAVMFAGYAYILLLMGRLEDSYRCNSRAVRLATERSDPNTLLYAYETAGHRALREGDLDLAHHEYLQLEQLIGEMGIGEPCVAAWAAHAVHAHLAAGHRDDADRVTAWLGDHSAALPCRWPRIALATANALRAAADGDPAAAEDHYRTALRHHDRTTLPLEKLQTLLAYAGSLRRNGHPARARSLLHEAIAIGETCRADWLVGYGRAELAIAGGRRCTHREPDRLTPAECRVADLAAAGLSNRRIAAHLSISETTVETHLRHIYLKQGITSRHQITPSAGR